MKNLKSLLIFGILLIDIICFAQQKDSLKIKDSKVLISENNREPLLIVNGEIYNSSISSLNPNNIESVTVLKPEIAASLYGNEGKNGAIIIQNKNITIRELKKIRKIQNHKIEFNPSCSKMEISGFVGDCEYGILPGIDILNLNSKKSTFSNFAGEFKIEACEKDVLQFKGKGFETQNVYVENQKQLDIKLKATLISGGGIMIKKPVIYLYSKEKIDVDFQIDFKGNFLTTFPKYENNWKLIVYPEGKIFDKTTNRFYTSLFWDGTFNFPKEHYNYKTGFVVSKNNLTSFLIQKLEHIGLNTFETNDFMQYWLPILERNDFNFIHFRVNENYDIISKNKITPKPDTEIRVFMDFYGLDKSISIPEQVLPKSKRKGFTLVEWGGSDVSVPVNEKNNL